MFEIVSQFFYPSLTLKLKDWGGVRSVLRGEGRFESNSLSMARKSHFGVKGGEKALAKLLGVNVKELEESRTELAFKLAEFEDYSLENRSIFFNSEDKRQMNELIAETGFKEKLAEGKNLLALSKKAGVEFREVVQSL